MTILEPFDTTNLPILFSDKKKITFLFTNSNAEILSYNSKDYTVVNILKNFTISFVDVEGDNVLMSIVNPGSINAYVRSIQPYNTYTLIVQANDGANTQTNVVLKYTDKYHQDAVYWKNLTISIDIFATEPPRYESPLQNISISACNWAKFTLPVATDPEGDSFTTSLDLTTPGWINLIDSNTLEICPLKSNLTAILSSQIVSIKLLDSTNASSVYSFYLNIDTSMLVKFDHVENVEIYFSEIYMLQTDIKNARSISLVDWLYEQLISWSNFNSTSNTIIINATDFSLVGTHWVRISAIDEWGNSKYSDEFNISIITKNPPVFLDKLSPITLMEGEKKISQYR